MGEFYYQKTINLSKPRTGQDIIGAMKEMKIIANEMDLIYNAQTDGDKSLKVGFLSVKPYNNVIILTGEELDREELVPEDVYEIIALGSYDWGNAVHAIGYGQKTVNDAVDKIAKDLEARL